MSEEVMVVREDALDQFNANGLGSASSFKKWGRSEFARRQRSSKRPAWMVEGTQLIRQQG